MATYLFWEDLDQSDNKIEVYSQPVSGACRESTENDVSECDKADFCERTKNKNQEKTTFEPLHDQMSDLKQFLRSDKVASEYNFEVCRVCLATKCRMFQLNGSQLRDIFNGLADKNSITMACWECTARLRNAARLVQKANVAQQILTQLAVTEVNANSVKSINRQIHNLASDLQSTTPTIIDIYSAEVEIKEEKLETEDTCTTDFNTECVFDNDQKFSDKQYPLEPSNIDEIIDDLDDLEAKSDDVPLKKIQEREKEERKKNKCVKKRRKEQKSDNPKRVKLKADVTENGKQRRQYPARSEAKEREIVAGFETRTLTTEQQMIEMEKRKNSERYLRRHYKCTDCYTAFHDEFNYNNHMIRHKEEWGKYECCVCKLRFKKKNKCKQHVIGMHAEEYSCKLCKKILKNRGAALRHLQWHAGTTYECPRCPAKFNHYSTYMSHRRLQHVSECEYVCEICGFTFLSKFGIHTHKCRMHPNDKSALEGPHCSVCNVKFVSEEAYTRHLSLSAKHISDQAPTKVKNDCTRFLSLGKNVPAGKYNSVKPPIICELCKVVVEGMREYARHFRLAHPGEKRVQVPQRSALYMVMCDQCGKKFQHISILRDHMSVHAGEKKYRCEVCDKWFAFRNSLRLHAAKHGDARRRHACDRCGREFSARNNMLRHRAIHDAQRSLHRCSVCDKCCTTKAGLQSHVKHVHQKIPWPARVRNSRRHDCPPD